MDGSQSPSEVMTPRDARVLAVVCDSRVIAAADRVIALTMVAWRSSAVSAALRTALDRAGTHAGAAGVRLGAGVTVVASATALAMQRTASPAPLTWIVPAVMLCAGVGLFAAARGGRPR